MTVLPSGHIGNWSATTVNGERAPPLPVTAVSGGLAGMRIEPGDARALKEGAVAWVAYRPIISAPQGMRVSTRVTAVLRREVDEWRIVQSHFSMGRTLNAYPSVTSPPTARHAPDD